MKGEDFGGFRGRVSLCLGTTTRRSPRAPELKLTVVNGKAKTDADGSHARATIPLEMPAIVAPIASAVLSHVSASVTHMQGARLSVIFSPPVNLR